MHCIVYRSVCIIIKIVFPKKKKSWLIHGLIKQKCPGVCLGGNAEVLNETAHKYFSQLNITNSDPTKQATPTNSDTIKSWINTTFIFTIKWYEEYNLGL